MALEGGYNTTSISYSFAACARVLLGHPPPPFSEPLRRPHAGALRDIATTIDAHAAYWTLLLPVQLPANTDEAEDIAARVDTMNLADGGMLMISCVHSLLTIL
eukprot:m.1159236 g.1159236  ORF g.1159236 m.1159236 type:complete len:103 (-) comp24501_c0_seq25:4221-4529(-)